MDPQTSYQKLATGLLQDVAALNSGFGIETLPSYNRAAQLKDVSETGNVTLLLRACPEFHF